MRVLLAEDDSIIADGIARALRKAGYAVDLSENGTDADTALQSCTYDLAILDIGLPRMTGLEVLRRLRARNTPAAPHVPWRRAPQTACRPGTRRSRTSSDAPQSCQGRTACAADWPRWHRTPS